jgi:hypothetical protein
MKGFTRMNENYPQILGINADFFFSLRSLRLCGSLFSKEFPMSGALTKMNENLSTDDTDSHRFFFSLRSLRLCGSLFS